MQGMLEAGPVQHSPERKKTTKHTALLPSLFNTDTETCQAHPLGKTIIIVRPCLVKICRSPKSLSVRVKF